MTLRAKFGDASIKVSGGEKAPKAFDRIDSKALLYDLFPWWMRGLVALQRINDI